MDDVGLLSGLLNFALLMGLGLGAVQLSFSHPDSRFQARIFLIAFALRFAVSVAIYQFRLIDIIKDEDASGWVVGAALQEHWLKEGTSFLGLPARLAEAYERQNMGHYYLLGGYFFVTGGSSRLTAAALNGFAGALTAVFVYRITRELFGEATARKAGWLACLYPALIIWSAQTVKEPVVILLEVVALYGAVCLRRRGLTGRHLFLTVAAVLLLVPFRFYAAYIAAAAAAVALLVPRSHKPGKQTQPAGTWLAAIPCLLVAFWLIQRDVQIERYNLEYIENFRTHAAREQSGVAPEFGLDSPAGFVGSVIIGALHLLFAPFPWQMMSGSLRMFLVGPEVLLWYWLVVVGVWPGIRYAFRHRFGDLLPALLFLLCLGLLYCVMFSNVGLVYRQRAQLMPFLLIFAAVGLQLRVPRKKRRDAEVSAALPHAAAVPALPPARSGV